MKVGVDADTNWTQAADFQWPTALLHGGDRIRDCPNPQRLMSPLLRCGRISGVQHPAFG